MIDHQNKTAPLYRLNGDLVSHWFKPVFDIFNPSRQVHTWNTIRYKEQKGFFSFLKKDSSFANSLGYQNKRNRLYLL